MQTPRHASRPPVAEALADLGLLDDEQGLGAFERPHLGFKV